LLLVRRLPFGGELNVRGDGGSDVWEVQQSELTKQFNRFRVIGVCGCFGGRKAT
jgi:hypothetical protein